MPIELVRDFGAEVVDWLRATAEITTTIAFINITFLKRDFILDLHNSVVITLKKAVNMSQLTPRRRSLILPDQLINPICSSKASRISIDLLAKGSLFYLVQVSDQLFAALFMVGIKGHTVFAYIRSAEHTALVKQPFVKMN